MNTAVAGNSNGFSAQNIGFAIPVAEIKILLPSLLRGGTVTKQGAYLGVAIQTMTPQLAQQYGIQTKTGALVMSVVPGSPADNAGMQAGDIIIQIGSSTIRTATDVTAAMRRHHPGDHVTIVVMRNDHRVSLPVTLGTSPG
jgi:serine protease Do